MKNFINFTALIGLSVMLVACGSGKDGKSSRRIEKGPLPEQNVSGSVLNIAFDSTIDTLDQQKAVYASAFEIIGSLIDGLMQMGDDGSVKKAICEEEIVSPDGLSYTFKLRKDVFWSNGEPVTAHDFVYGWQRAVDPATESEYAFLMSDIAQVKNAGAIMAGQMEPNQLGVRAVDDYTFEVQLTVSVSFFDQLLYFCTFYPANQKFIEKMGESYATSPDTYLSNGAFILTDYKPNSKNFKLMKNTAYYDANSVKIAGLNYVSVQNGEDALRKYQSGQLDLVELDGEQVKTQKSNPDFKSIDSGFLYYVAFNLDNPIFKNINMRKAISLAVDRESIAEEIADGSIAAYACVPKGYTFSSTGSDFTPGSIEFPDVCSYNPSAAKKYYAEAQSELGRKTFEIEFLVADLDAQRIAARSIKRQVEALLPGIHINIKLVPKSERRKAMVAHKFEMGLTNWGPDYADPMTYLAMWVTGNDNNHGNYANPKYNALISNCTDGDLCTKPDERWLALKKAETMVMEDVAVMPVYQQCNADLIKPNVKGIAFHAVAINRIYKHATK